MDSSQNVSREPGQEPQAAKSPVPPQPAYVPTAYGRKELYRDDSRYKSPALATLLSLMPGLGQIYIGYYQQGFINILVVASLIALLARGVGALEPLLGLFLAFFWLYNLVDAARRATFYNQALAGLGPTELPGVPKAPDRRGALLGGILMIIVGGLAFAHMQFGMPLEWLERWWPLALVIMGGYLIFQSVMAQRKKQ